MNLIVEPLDHAGGYLPHRYTRRYTNNKKCHSKIFADIGKEKGQNQEEYCLQAFPYFH